MHKDDHADFYLVKTSQNPKKVKLIMWVNGGGGNETLRYKSLHNAPRVKLKFAQIKLKCQRILTLVMGHS